MLVNLISSWCHFNLLHFPWRTKFCEINVQHQLPCPLFVFLWGKSLRPWLLVCILFCTSAKYNNAKNKKDMHNLGSGLFQHVVRIVWVSMNPKKLKRPVNPLRLRIKVFRAGWKFEALTDTLSRLCQTPAGLSHRVLRHCMSTRAAVMIVLYGPTWPHLTQSCGTIYIATALSLPSLPVN